MNHEYIDPATGEIFPHITGLLEAAGKVDDTWFTEESSARGTAVHRLTAAHDLAGLEVDKCESIFRGYLLSYIKAIELLQAQILEVELPAVHPRLLFGGRPDRDVMIYGLRGVLEIKSGQRDPVHKIQTAMQAILREPATGIPAWGAGRWCVYVQDNGKFKVDSHHLQPGAKSDIDEALSIIHRYGRKAA